MRNSRRKYENICFPDTRRCFALQQFSYSISLSSDPGGLTRWINKEKKNTLCILFWWICRSFCPTWTKNSFDSLEQKHSIQFVSQSLFYLIDSSIFIVADGCSRSIYIQPTDFTTVGGKHFIVLAKYSIVYYMVYGHCEEDMGADRTVRDRDAHVYCDDINAVRFRDDGEREST